MLAPCNGIEDSAVMKQRKKHLCSTCGSSFTKPSDLIRHERTHTGEKPFKCNVCGASFSQTSSLKIHFRKHTGERPFKCQYCQATFVHSHRLKSHITKFHKASNSPLSCQVCGLEFGHQLDLERHVSSHTNSHETNCTDKDKSKVSNSDSTWKLDSQKLDTKKAINGNISKLLISASGPSHGQDTNGPKLLISVSGTAGNHETPSYEMRGENPGPSHGQDTNGPKLLISASGTAGNHETPSYEMRGENPGPSYGQDINGPKLLISVSGTAGNHETPSYEMLVENPAGPSYSHGGVKNNINVPNGNPGPSYSHGGVKNNINVPNGIGTDLESDLNHECECFMCHICGQFHSDATSLESHLNSHQTNQSFQCIFCLQNFTSPSLLKNHLNLHSHDAPYYCKSCYSCSTFSKNFKCQVQIHSQGNSILVIQEAEINKGLRLSTTQTHNRLAGSFEKQREWTSEERSTLDNTLSSAFFESGRELVAKTSGDDIQKDLRDKLVTSPSISFDSFPTFQDHYLSETGSLTSFLDVTTPGMQNALSEFPVGFFGNQMDQGQDKATSNTKQGHVISMMTGKKSNEISLDSPNLDLPFLNSHKFVQNDDMTTSTTAIGLDKIDSALQVSQAFKVLCSFSPRSLNMSQQANTSFASSTFYSTEKRNESPSPLLFLDPSITSDFFSAFEGNFGMSETNLASSLMTDLRLRDIPMSSSATIEFDPSVVQTREKMPLLTSKQGSSINSNQFSQQNSGSFSSIAEIVGQPQNDSMTASSSFTAEFSDGFVDHMISVSSSSKTVFGESASSTSSHITSSDSLLNVNTIRNTHDALNTPVNEAYSPLDPNPSEFTIREKGSSFSDLPSMVMSENSTMAPYHDQFQPLGVTGQVNSDDASLTVHASNDLEGYQLSESSRPVDGRLIDELEVLGSANRDFNFTREETKQPQALMGGKKGNGNDDLSCSMEVNENTSLLPSNNFTSLATSGKEMTSTSASEVSDTNTTFVPQVKSPEISASVQEKGLKSEEKETNPKCSNCPLGLLDDSVISVLCEDECFGDVVERNDQSNKMNAIKKDEYYVKKGQLLDGGQTDEILQLKRESKTRNDRSNLYQGKHEAASFFGLKEKDGDEVDTELNIDDEIGSGNGSEDVAENAFKYSHKRKGHVGETPEYVSSQQNQVEKNVQVQTISQPFLNEFATPSSKRPKDRGSSTSPSILRVSPQLQTKVGMRLVDDAALSISGSEVSLAVPEEGGEGNNQLPFHFNQKQRQTPPPSKPHFNSTPSTLCKVKGKTKSKGNYAMTRTTRVKGQIHRQTVRNVWGKKFQTIGQSMDRLAISEFRSLQHRKQFAKKRRKDLYQLPAVTEESPNLDQQCLCNDANCNGSVRGQHLRGHRFRSSSSSSGQHCPQSHDTSRKRSRNCQICHVSYVFCNTFNKNPHSNIGRVNTSIKVLKITTTTGIEETSHSNCDLMDTHLSGLGKSPQFSENHDKIQPPSQVTADRRGVPAYLCHLCGETLSSLRSLNCHLKNHSRKTYQCELCSATFKKKSNLVKHLRIHNGERPYRCEVCSRSFTQLINLQVHKRIHTGQRPYSCQECPATFAHSQALKLHMRFHTKDVRFTCDTCGKGFVVKAGLDKHLRSHTGEKPYVCTVCGSSLSSASSLSRHSKKHKSEDGRLPFTCDICSSKFAQSSHLKLHVKSHSSTL